MLEDICGIREKTGSLQRILKIFWPKVISNEKLLKITRMSIISETIQKDADAGLVVIFELLPTNSPGLLFAGQPGNRNRGRSKRPGDELSSQIFLRAKNG